MFQSVLLSSLQSSHFCVSIIPSVTMDHRLNRKLNRSKTRLYILSKKKKINGLRKSVVCKVFWLWTNCAAMWENLTVVCQQHKCRSACASVRSDQPCVLSLFGIYRLLHIFEWMKDLYWLQNILFIHTLNAQYYQSFKLSWNLQYLYHNSLNFGIQILDIKILNWLKINALYTFGSFFWFYTINLGWSIVYSETCLKRSLKIDKTKVLKPCGSLMQKAMW